MTHPCVGSKECGCSGLGSRKLPDGVEIGFCIGTMLSYAVDQDGVRRCPTQREYDEYVRFLVFELMPRDSAL